MRADDRILGYDVLAFPARADLGYASRIDRIGVDGVRQQRARRIARQVIGRKDPTAAKTAPMSRPSKRDHIDFNLAVIGEVFKKLSKGYLESAAGVIRNPPSASWRKRRH
jgi:hypothetical protein